MIEKSKNSYKYTKDFWRNKTKRNLLYFEIFFLLLFIPPGAYRPFIVMFYIIKKMEIFLQ